MADDKVIFLAFSNPEKVESASITVVACRACTNKTWVLIEGPDKFPILRCAVCGVGAGKVGWVHDDA